MRSACAMVAGLATVAVVAVGCAADPAATDEPLSAPAIYESDTQSPVDADDEATDDERPSPPDTQPPSEPAKPLAAKPTSHPAVEPAAITDGSHTGRLVSTTTAEITVELIRILSGEEAIEADGVAGLDGDGTLPNDIHVQDLDRVATMPVAGDAGVRIYDCTSACEIVGTTLAALASGEVVPYGGPNVAINLIVDHGSVVSFEEQYLP